MDNVPSERLPKRTTEAVFAASPLLKPIWRWWWTKAPALSEDSVAVVARFYDTVGNFGKFGLTLLR